MDNTLEKVRDDDAHVKKEVKAAVKQAEERVEEQITKKFELLIIQYNANVLKFWNLELFKEDYLLMLAHAWE